MTQTVTQAEFARIIGVARSYVTALKSAGRLVMTADGLVDVEASKTRIQETRDPNRDDVAARHAAARNPAAALAPSLPVQPNDDVSEPGGTDSMSYAAARAIKEKYAAKTAKLDYDRAIGLMVERAAVDAAVEDVMTTVRQALEQQPHRLAPLLVGQDLDAIRITLKQETARILGEMVHTFAKRLRQIAGEEEKEPVA